MTPTQLSMIPLSAEVLSRTPQEAIELILWLYGQVAAFSGGIRQKRTPGEKTTHCRLTWRPNLTSYLNQQQDKTL
jgi:hypothetical protein